MMIVPRQYAQAAPRKVRSTEFSEKGNGSYRSTPSASSSPRARSPLSSSLLRSREPSPSPSKVESRPRLARLQPQSQEGHDVPKRPQPTPSTTKEVRQFRPDSVKDVLSATAIPIRRKQKGRPSQRLPKGDHVTNFASLLMDDVKPFVGGGLSRSASSSNFEGLFGNMDELLEDGQMYVGSEGLDSGILSTRSMSNDSLVSMASPDDFALSDHNSQHSSVDHSVPERRTRQVATSEDCSDDHPLSPPKDDYHVYHYISQLPPSPPALRRLPGQSEVKVGASLKSSLTASLKALKSAAQSLSTRTHGEPVNVRAPSFFDFQPALTDDRRPPPSLDTPDAELRRYLNPPPLDSAAQLHFWQDHRHSNFAPAPSKETRKRTTKGRKVSIGRGSSPPGTNPMVDSLPPIVQLNSFLPSSVRTEHASSPPIWLASDGTPVNKNTAISLLFDPNVNYGKGEHMLRHREPRENRDFLRVYVSEMQMRRAGKLSEDLSTGRARLWLPPIGDPNAKAKPKREGETILMLSDERVQQKRTARERMMCISIDDV